MTPPPSLRPDFSRRGFTLVGGLASLALLATAVAVCVPLVVKRLRAHAPAADDAARRVEAAVTRSLESVGRLADSSGGLPDLPAFPGVGPAAAALPDSPARPFGAPAIWDGPVNTPCFPLPEESRRFFWKPFFTRPAPWYFYRRPPWRAGIGRRK